MKWLIKKIKSIFCKSRSDLNPFQRLFNTRCFTQKLSLKKESSFSVKGGKCTSPKRGNCVVGRISLKSFSKGPSPHNNKCIGKSYCFNCLSNCNNTICPPARLASWLMKSIFFVKIWLLISANFLIDYLRQTPKHVFARLIYQ